jgi:hypothetical protein
MNKTALKVLVGIVALALAGCAAYFSIIGLSKLFAGASIAVIAMASTLEASKLVIASFLYQNWKTVNKTLRAYLSIAVTVIAIITSMGIYGYLSGAYQTTKSKYDLTQTQTDSLAAKKSYYDASITTYKTQLESKNVQLLNLTSIRNSQEQRATQLITSNRSSNSADRSARQTDKTLKTLNKEIEILNTNILAYSDSSSKLQVSMTQLGLKNELSSELGSLTYISKVLDVPMDKIVNVLILLFIIVFDPLAICMVLAFNFLNKSNEEGIKETKISRPERPVAFEVPEIVFKEKEPRVELPEIQAEQSSETPQISSIIEPLNIVPPMPDKDDIYDEKKPIIDEREMLKRKKIQKGYVGGVSTETKIY